MYFGEHKRLP